MSYLCDVFIMLSHHLPATKMLEIDITLTTVTIELLFLSFSSP